MNNDQLRAEADLLVQKCRLSELLDVYPKWFIGGSYNYELMCWRDMPSPATRAVRVGTPVRSRF